MSRIFSTYNELTDFIQDEIIARVPGAQMGVSSRSISRYVEVDVVDDDGDIVGSRRVRISDHDATASCGDDIVFEIDTRRLNIEEIYDECNEFEHIEVGHDWLIPDMIKEAVEALTK